MRLNPLKIILLWITGMFIIGCFVVVPKFFSSWGGEQTPLTSLAYLILITTYGVLLLSIFTALIYFTWFKKYWYVNVFFLLVTLPIVSKVFLVGSTYQYSIKEKREYINNDTIDIKEEYYSFTPKRIRSTSYWRNGLKDSVWTVYDERGSIIKQEIFKNDELLKVLDNR
jgi:hypothetical protein